MHPKHSVQVFVIMEKAPVKKSLLAYKTTVKNLLCYKTKQVSSHLKLLQYQLQSYNVMFFPFNVFLIYVFKICHPHKRKWWLNCTKLPICPTYLEQSLEEHPSPVDIMVFLQSLEYKVKEQCLVWWCCQLGVQKFLVEGRVEPGLRNIQTI